MLQGRNIHYEIDGRHTGISSGGIGTFHVMNKNLGITKAVDDALHLLRRNLFYYESDPVLNIAYNIIAGGTRLEDIDLLRQDEPG